MLTYYPSSLEETTLLAQSFAQKLKPGTTICFFGDLGAGKTTFIKALLQELGISSELIVSPTFQYLNVYQENLRSIPVFHFDLYRLPNHEEFVNSGFHEFFSHRGICCIEWAERIESILPKEAIQIRISHVPAKEGLDQDTRKVEITVSP